jgi:hypothetical protein
MNPHTHQVFVGSSTPKWIPKFSERNCRGQNSLPQRVLYIIEKLLKHRCLNWVCIAHLDIWNISYEQKKGWESTRFPCMQVTCDILLQSSRRRLQLCFRPHRNRRSTCQVMHPQSCESPNWGNFGTPTLESWDKKPFGCGPRGEA